MVIVAGVVLLASACDGDEASPDTTPPGDVVPLPQNPSLRLFVEDGTTFVENDGNVTMSDVAVREQPGDVVCDVGTLAPGDLEPCEAAAGRDDLVAYGLGPQGQVVDGSSD